MDSAHDAASLRRAGYPIRTSPDQRLVATSPRLFAGSDVLHRLILSRHPPYALIVFSP